MSSGPNTAASRPLLAEAFANYRKSGPDALCEIGIDLMREGAKARMAGNAAPKRRTAAPRR
ncbi:hypothetical protein [uncultured Variovorax sp.]|uniref:hypothetical protein n=1 Tax=uncultured Variovorax sp. TaxID=114708 RepID=UPI0025DD1723|nr:hypothetical protein [uncultured Variovorax sp.]